MLLIFLFLVIHLLLILCIDKDCLFVPVEGIFLVAVDLFRLFHDTLIKKIWIYLLLVPESSCLTGR